MSGVTVAGTSNLSVVEDSSTLKQIAMGANVPQKHHAISVFSVFSTQNGHFRPFFVFFVLYFGIGAPGGLPIVQIPSLYVIKDFPCVTGVSLAQKA